MRNIAVKTRALRGQVIKVSNHLPFTYEVSSSTQNSLCKQDGYPGACPWMLSVWVDANPPTKKTWYISACHNKINRWYDSVATFISETVPTKQKTCKTRTQAFIALFLISFWKLAIYHGFQRYDSFKDQHLRLTSWRYFICSIWYKLAKYPHQQYILNSMIKLSDPIIGSRVTALEWVKTCYFLPWEHDRHGILFLV